MLGLFCALRSGSEYLPRFPRALNIGTSMCTEQKVSTVTRMKTDLKEKNASYARVDGVRVYKRDEYEMFQAMHKKSRQYCSAVSRNVREHGMPFH